MHSDNPTFRGIPEQWSDLLDRPLSDFMLLIYDESAAYTRPVEAYGLGLKFYLLGRIVELENLITQLKKGFASAPSPEMNEVVALLELRLRVRQRNLTEAELEVFSKRERQNLAEALKGECVFVQGQASEVLRNFENGFRYFRQAAEIFERSQCPRKSCRARLNSLGNYSFLHPHQDLIAEHLALVDYAVGVGDEGSAGVALINVAREYQKLGSLDIALRHVDQALTCLSKEKGTLHKGLGLLQKAHILYDQKKIPEAKLILQEVRAFNFPEVREAAKLLESKMTNPGSAPSVTLANLVPEWRERLRDFFTSSEEIQNMEQKAIRLLSERPLDKFELMREIYDSGIPEHILDNRLRNLLNRIRKKYPGRLVLEENKYFFKA